MVEVIGYDNVFIRIEHDRRRKVERSRRRQTIFAVSCDRDDRGGVRKTAKKRRLHKNRDKSNADRNLHLASFSNETLEVIDLTMSNHFSNHLVISRPNDSDSMLSALTSLNDI